MSKSATMKTGARARRSARPSTANPPRSRNTKLVMGAGAVIAVLGGLIIAAQPETVTRSPTAVELVKASVSNPAGRLSTSETRFSFGPISMAHGKVTHRHPISNVGTEPLVIRKMYTSCMCTTAALVKNGKTSDAYGMPGHAPIPTINVPINPREEAFIEVVFDPAAHGPAGVGPIERVVTVENSAGQPLELAFSALVSP